MAQKVILYLSTLGEYAKETEYTCPNGETVLGTQTNEAPVKHLLNQHRNISEILCVVTDAARNSGAWDVFSKSIASVAPRVKLYDIAYAEEQDFSRGPVMVIMEHFQNKSDELLLEITGGPRDAVMQLLLVSRILSYKGIKTVGVVYSNNGKKKIEDASNLSALFDLVGGMQELSSFGSVRTLRTYYEQQKVSDSKIGSLLNAMEHLQEAIILCRTAQLEERMAQFNTAIEEAEDCSDPLMRALLPAFQAKFGTKMNTPSVIRWCVENDMLQQALTIYKEHMPDYLINERADILQSKLNQPDPNDQKKNETRFMKFVIKAGANIGKARDDPTADYAVRTLKYIDQVVAFSEAFTFHCTPDQLAQIVEDYMYVRLLRNLTNHASNQSQKNTAEQITYMQEDGYPAPEKITVQELRKVLLNALEHMKEREGSAK